MRTLATQQRAKDSAKQEKHGEFGRSSLAVSGVRSLSLERRGAIAKFGGWEIGAGEGGDRWNDHIT